MVELVRDWTVVERCYTTFGAVVAVDCYYYYCYCLLEIDYDRTAESVWVEMLWMNLEERSEIEGDNGSFQAYSMIATWMVLRSCSAAGC